MKKEGLKVPAKKLQLNPETLRVLDPGAGDLAAAGMGLGIIATERTCTVSLIHPC